MSAIDLLLELTDRGVRLVSDGKTLRFRPVGAVTDRLLDELRRLKPDLLHLLQSPATGEARSRVIDRANERVNAVYWEAAKQADVTECGGPIDWPAVEAAIDRLFAATTFGDLHTAAVEFLNAVAAPMGPPRYNG